MSHEDSVRKLVQDFVLRGRIEVHAGFAERSGGRRVTVDRDLLAAAIALLKSELWKGELDFDPPSAGQLLGIPGLFALESPPLDSGATKEALVAATTGALQELTTMRRNEGEALRRHLSGRREDLAHLVNRIEERAPSAVAAYRERLERRLRESLLASDVDPGRLAAEVAIVAERTSVEEELARLHSHLTQLEALLEDGKAVGRKLDFLLQEMQREINTAGAKNSDLVSAQAVLDAKHVLEQMREQAQNVE